MWLSHSTRWERAVTPAPLQVAESDNVLLNSLEGLVGYPVDITIGGFRITSANITMGYDQADLGDVSEDDLTMFWVDEDNKRLVALDAVQVNKDNNTVTGTITHFSTFLLGDRNMPVDLSKVDIVFCIDQSGSMRTNDPNHYRIKATKKFVANIH